ncbi:YciI family protein [Rugosimonospora africana]|uniref:Transcription initiation protein n=1 Tax=Rugosimonospora africana TaxID=556532 RepID=A0A8J3QK56_9ACTN|nr:YciI family protein [Rugosimonospora africana]GIH12465.1 transcription initiation protein [Rugosimonospora africana]
MKFMLFICVDTAALETLPEKPVEGPMPWADELNAAGIRLDGDRLRSPDAATTVRVRGGEVLLGDGPFAETKEVIIGYDVIECTNLDEAIAIAARHPVAEGGLIEVRPFFG